MANITKLSAKNSEVFVDVSGTATKMAAVSNWSLNCNRNTIDVSTIGTEWKEYLPGQISADGSFDLIFDPTNDSTATLIENDMFNGTELKFSIRPEGTGNGKSEYSLNAYVTGWNIAGATEDALTVSVSFQGTGPITKSVQA